MFKRLMDWCVAHHKTTTLAMVAATAALALLAALPSVWPEAFPRLHGVQVDTDPENMLPATEHVRVFNNAMKQEFALYDMLVVGVVNDRAPDYVFNPATLRDIHELTEYAKTLRGEALGKPEDPQAGVIGIDIIAPSTVDNVEQGGLGAVTRELDLGDGAERTSVVNVETAGVLQRGDGGLGLTCGKAQRPERELCLVGFAWTNHADRGAYREAALPLQPGDGSAAIDGFADRCRSGIQPEFLLRIETTITRIEELAAFAVESISGVHGVFQTILLRS